MDLAWGVLPFYWAVPNQDVGMPGTDMRYRPALTLAPLILLLSLPVFAQIQPAPPQPDDQTGAQYDSQAPDQYQGPGQAQPQQPTTTVARISLIQGNVSTQRGDTGDWTAATVNTPVVPGDRVSTGDRARAEVQLDFANIIRLDQNAVIRVTDLSPHHLQFELAQGLLSFDSFPASDSDVEIDTPNLAIHPQRDGVYRIEVSGDGETLVTVRRGQVEVGTTEGSTTLAPGQQITVRGDAATAQYRTSAAGARDGFDDWNENRDRTLRASLNKQNLSPYYTGGADLDQNGTWQNVPDYGQVWTPNNVPPDWAPYRDGSWVWEPGWGWTWVSYEPWGWAPYHYGRWFQWNGGWAWWPGPVYPYYRPLWAPAYVSFFGFGRGFGFGFGFGSFGWLPIGPADPFYPWWGGFGLSFEFGRFGEFGHYRGRGFVAPLAGPLRGRAEFSNLRGLDTNARLRAGITSESAARFGNGRVVPDGHRFSAEEIHGAQFARGGLPVAPGRGSLSASGRPAAAGTVPSRNLDSQHFMAHNQPRVQQHSFAAESANVRQQIDRQRSSPGNGGARRTPGGESPRSSFTRQESGAQAQGNRAASGSAGAGRSFVQSSNPGVRQQQPSESGNRGAWQRFSPQQGQSGFSGGRGTTSGSQSYQNAQRYQTRQPLDLHKSIVQQRAPSNGSTRGAYGYGTGANPYSSAPHSQPAYRAPEPQPQRGYSAGAPHYGAQSAPPYSAPSAPRGNPGGAYRGGGGNRGGGNRSGGGGPTSGGGSHSGGGGSHGGKPHN